MQIGVNFLTEVQELFEEGKLDFIDYFKLYSLNDDLSGVDWCAQNRWLMFHGLCGKPSAIATKDLVKEIDIEQTKKYLEISKAPYISCHINSFEPSNSEEEYLENAKNNIKELKEIFGKDIAIENCPFRTRYGAWECLFRPEIISKIVYDNDVKFLFDFSHAMTSARHLNMPIEEYISKLPMDKAVEVHLAGVFEFPDVSKEDVRKNLSPSQIEGIEKLVAFYGSKYDNHGTLHEEDYALIEKILREYKNIEFVTLEYGSPNLKPDIKDDDYPYPICRFGKVNQKAKEEILSQLTRIKNICDNI